MKLLAQGRYRPLGRHEANRRGRCIRGGEENRWECSHVRSVSPPPLAWPHRDSSRPVSPSVPARLRPLEGAPRVRGDFGRSPARVLALQGVAVILHAGDIDAERVLAALERIAPVTAVAGNKDAKLAQLGLPVTARVVEMKLEEDRDIHLVISEPSEPSATMITEFPDADQCSDAVRRHTLKRCARHGRRWSLRSASRPPRSSQT